jgi:hypothetical protein
MNRLLALMIFIALLLTLASVTVAQDDAEGIFVECPDGEEIFNGSEVIINMRTGFTYTVTALGIDDFDPIMAAVDENGDILCNDDASEARDAIAWLPTTGEIENSRNATQINFTFTGSGFGDVSFIVGEANGDDGEFILIVEGLAVTEADGSGDGAGDPFVIHLTPNMLASEIPVTAYMISVTSNLDTFVYAVNEDNEGIILDDGGLFGCDDAGRDGYCFGESEVMSDYYVSRSAGRGELGGGEFDAYLTLYWELMGLEPGDDGFVTLRYTSSEQRTFGDYVAVFHIGTASEFDN